MPWVYTIKLAEPTDAQTIQDDWKASASEGVAHEYGGVSSLGLSAIVVSTPREPNYSDIESKSYIESVSEYKKIPSVNKSDFKPPIELAPGFTLFGGQTIDGVDFD